MKRIDVCLTPELLHLYDLSQQTVVVVDILRATSTMVTALAHGAKEIIPVASIEDCFQYSKLGYITSGERDGKKVAGFDKGNSPFEYMDESIHGKKIAFTTTNGTMTIKKSAAAKEVVIGSFLNLNSVAKHLLFNENDALIVCAGWKGRVNLEDTMFAGALVDRLKDYLGPDCDAPLMAQQVYSMGKKDMLQFLKKSSHVNRLSKLGIEKDVAFCLETDKYNLLPVMEGTSMKIKD